MARKSCRKEVAKSCQMLVKAGLIAKYSTFLATRGKVRVRIWTNLDLALEPSLDDEQTIEVVIEENHDLNRIMQLVLDCVFGTRRYEAWAKLALWQLKQEGLIDNFTFTPPSGTADAKLKVDCYYLQGDKGVFLQIISSTSKLSRKGRRKIRTLKKRKEVKIIKIGWDDCLACIKAKLLYLLRTGVRQVPAQDSFSYACWSLNRLTNEGVISDFWLVENTGFMVEAQTATYTFNIADLGDAPLQYVEKKIRSLIV